MSKTTLAPMPLQASPKRGNNTVELGAIAKQQFVSAALTMSWQLAVVVLLPIIGGVELDKAIAGTSLYLFIGLGIALLGTIVVLRQALRTANRLPVPKLSAAQKRTIAQAYKEEDDD